VELPRTGDWEDKNCGHALIELSAVFRANGQILMIDHTFGWTQEKFLYLVAKNILHYCSYSQISASFSKLKACNA